MGSGLFRFWVSPHSHPSQSHSQGFSQVIPVFPLPFLGFFPVFPLTALDGGEFGGEGGGDAGVPQLHHRSPFLFQIPQHLAQPLLRDWERHRNSQTFPKSPGTAGKAAPNPPKSSGRSGSLGSWVMGLKVPSHLQNSRIYSLFIPDLRSLPTSRIPGLGWVGMGSDPFPPKPKFQDSQH